MTLIVILAVLALAVAGARAVSRDARRARILARDWQRATDALQSVETIARNNYELSPQMAQCILDELNAYQLAQRMDPDIRKELG